MAAVALASSAVQLLTSLLDDLQIEGSFGDLEVPTCCIWNCGCDAVFFITYGGLQGVLGVCVRACVCVCACTVCTVCVCEHVRERDSICN